jgi:VanZ family protein
VRRQRSSAWLLAAAFAALVVYASLHPFGGWRLPPGGSGWPGWALPRPGGQSRFDVISNVLAYLPLGALLAAARLRDQGGRSSALLLAVLAPGLLSYALEQAQHFLPPRVPSVVDWQLNTAGAAAGALLTLAADARGALAAWQRWRARWLLPGQAGGLTLLLLWPVGLLFPPPLPFGLGQVLGRLHAVGAGWWDDLPGPDALPPADLAVAAPLSPGLEFGGILAGLLAPCLLACSISRPGGQRAALLAGGLLMGVTATTLSTALNFGPAFALAWITPPLWPAIGAATLLLLPLCALPTRAALPLGLGVILAGLVIVHVAPADPYYAASLQAWEEGRFVRLHGLAQWIGWLWPYAALAFLARRLALRAP